MIDLLGSQNNANLYFITQFKNNGTNTIYTGILKTDLDMNLDAMASLEGDPVNYGAAMSDDGNYLYIVFNSPVDGYFAELNANDLSVNAYYSLQDANSQSLGAVKSISNTLFGYIRLEPGDIFNACKWVRLDTQVSCFSYGRAGFINFTPIDQNTVFINLMMIGNDHLYFVKADFSNPTVLSWEKYVQCTTS